MTRAPLALAFLLAALPADRRQSAVETVHASESGACAPNRGHSSHARHGSSRHRSSHRRSRHGAHRSRATTHRRPPRPVVTQAYIRMRNRWHAPASVAERRAWATQDPPPLVLRPVGGGAARALVPTADGTFGPDALAAARDAFRDRDDGLSADVHPRLLEVCYRAVQRFHAPYVYLVSGYRTTRATSRHNQGRAMDIVLPGVSDERLATFLREQGFVGVGTYPTSGFTHLDVRARSYYWVDRSGPEQETMTEPVRAAEIVRHDSAARRRGELPVADLVPGAAESDEGRPRAEATDGASEGGPRAPRTEGAHAP